MSALPSSYKQSAITASASSSTFKMLRQELLDDISLSFEHVLININKLNRSLEGVIAVGHEFASVEALWSTFENVMTKASADTPEVDVSSTPHQQNPNPPVHDETAQSKIMS